MTTKAVEQFGGRVRESRLALDMTQYQLARISGLSESWISHFETGKRKPSVGNLIKLADALKVSTDYLLGRPLNRNILRGTK